MTTAKSAEPSAKQGAGALDESIPKGAEASVSDGFEQQGLATSPSVKIYKSRCVRIFEFLTQNHER